MNSWVGSDDSQQSTNVHFLSSPEGLVNRTVRVVIGSVHLNVRKTQASTGFDYLLAEALHQAHKEEQHGVTQGNGSHSDQGPPGTTPEIAPGNLENLLSHRSVLRTEKWVSLISAGEYWRSGVNFKKVAACDISAKFRIYGGVGP